jgi:hypothetical protein
MSTTGASSSRWVMRLRYQKLGADLIAGGYDE